MTVEGLGGATDVQTAFVECGAIQCGFCTPGLIMAATNLLERSPEPQTDEIREALAGNLCRCTGYGRIVEAVQTVIAQRGQVPRERSWYPQSSVTVASASRRCAQMVAKSEGAYEFSSDLSADNMLIGKTLRSPHQHARIVSINTAPALAISGVHRIITVKTCQESQTTGSFPLISRCSSRCRSLHWRTHRRLSQMTKRYALVP